MKKLMIAIGVTVILGIAGWFVWRPTPAAPEVAFASIDGKRILLQDLRGKVVLVKFWATDCVTCIKQMPDTIADYNRYGPQGFHTVAVAMQYDPPNYVLNYAHTRQLPFTVALDTQGKVAQAFGNVRLTPTAFLINKQGNIIKRYLGDYDRREFHAQIEKALATD
jgi:peroxiredoxin